MGLISEAVREHGQTVLDRLAGRADGHPCDGSKYHSPTPLVVDDVWLSAVVSEAIGAGTPDEQPAEKPVWLCGTCKDNLRVFVLLMHASSGSLSWQVRREFGNKIRDLGVLAWDMYGGVRA